MSCATGAMEGMITSTETTEWTTSGLSFGGCTFLGIGATVNTNGCNFNFHASGTMDIVGFSPCSTEGITFSAVGCKVQIKPQSFISGTEYQNFGSGTTREVVLEFNTFAIAYTASGCLENGNLTNGRIEDGLTFVKGFTTTFGTRQGIFVS